jgi:hypothetical protein
MGMLRDDEMAMRTRPLLRFAIGTHAGIEMQSCYCSCKTWVHSLCVNESPHTQMQPSKARRISTNDSRSRSLCTSISFVLMPEWAVPGALLWCYLTLSSADVRVVGWRKRSSCRCSAPRKHVRRHPCELPATDNLLCRHASYTKWQKTQIVVWPGWWVMAWISSVQPLVKPRDQLQGYYVLMQLQDACYVESIMWE